jgi:hypothetical protein
MPLVPGRDRLIGIHEFQQTLVFAMASDQSNEA